MSQVFPRGANTIARLSIPALLLISLIVIDAILVQGTSPYTYGPVGIAVEQPVRFSHELHSGDLNIGCQYCHTAAEQSAYAGIPDTHTCMSCHSQIATYSELLQPVRDSWETGEPLVWAPVHDLADHVYFNHSIHVNSGFGCETCHGRVDQMPLVWRAETMTMGWCLECHREPERFIRPVEEVYTHGYIPDRDQEELGMELVVEYGIAEAAAVSPSGVVVERLENCSICHR